MTIDGYKPIKFTVDLRKDNSANVTSRREADDAPALSAAKEIPSRTLASRPPAGAGPRPVAVVDPAPMKDVRKLERALLRAAGKAIATSTSSSRATGSWSPSRAARTATRCSTS